MSNIDPDIVTMMRVFMDLHLSGEEVILIAEKDSVTFLTTIFNEVAALYAEPFVFDGCKLIFVDENKQTPENVARLIKRDYGIFQGSVFIGFSTDKFSSNKELKAVVNGQYEAS